MPRSFSPGGSGLGFATTSAAEPLSHTRTNLVWLHFLRSGAHHRYQFLRFGAPPLHPTSPNYVKQEWQIPFSFWQRKRVFHLYRSYLCPLSWNWKKLVPCLFLGECSLPLCGGVAIWISPWRFWEGVSNILYLTFVSRSWNGDEVYKGDVQRKTAILLSNFMLNLSHDFVWSWLW